MRRVNREHNAGRFPSPSALFAHIVGSARDEGIPRHRTCVCHSPNVDTLPVVVRIKDYAIRTGVPLVRRQF